MRGGAVETQDEVSEEERLERLHGRLARTGLRDQRLVGGEVGVQSRATRFDVCVRVAGDGKHGGAGFLPDSRQQHRATSGRSVAHDLVFIAQRLTTGGDAERASTR
jgi:hypothetical protein